MSKLLNNIVFLIVSMVVLSATIFAATSTQTELVSTVTVSQASPSFETAYLDDQNSGTGGAIDLTANNTKTVYCFGTVTDANGYGNLAWVTGVIFLNSVGYAPNGTADNEEIRYSNSSCPLTQTNGTAATYECGFAVQWFANASTWGCYVNVSDDNGNLGGKIAGTQTLNAQYSLAIPAVMDFGTLSVGATSTDDVNTTIESYSNAIMDVQVNGTDLGGAGCTGAVSSIAVENVSYSATPDTAKGSMTDLTATATTVDLTIVKATSTTPTTDLLHWKIYIPDGTQGVCNGTVTFTAVANS